MATKKIVVEIEVPEDLHSKVTGEIREKLARASVRILLADLLAEEAGLTKEEAIWLEQQVKKKLAEKRS